MAEQILIEFVSDNSQLTPSINLLEKIGAVTAEDAAQFKKFAAESKKAFTTTATESKTTVKSLSDVQKSVITLTKTIEDGFAESVKEAFTGSGMSAEQFGKKLKDSLGETEQVSMSLKAQLRQLKEELSRMDDAGQSNTQTFINMAVEAARLEDQIGDTAARVRALASDTADIDAAVEGIQAVAAGFQIAAGAQELFGEENEDVQKAIAKLNAIMAITTGIQQLKNSLQKETILVQKLEIIGTKAAAIAQNIYAVAVGTSTGAMRAFRMALLATGIGAIVALLIIAAQKMNLFGDSTKDAAEALKEQKEAADKLVESLNDIIDVSAKARAAQKGGTDELKRQLEILKARGASAGEIYKKEQQIRSKELDELRIAGNSYLNLYNTRKKTGQLTAADAEAIQEKINSINKDGLDKANEIEAAKLSYAKTTEEKRKHAAKEAADKASQLAERNAKALFEIDQRKIEKEKALLKEAADNENNSLQFRLTSLQQYNTLTIQLIELQRKEELSQAKLTSTEIKNINDKFNTQALEATEAYGKAKLNIIKQNNDKEQAEHQARLQDFKDSELSILNQTISNIDQIYAALANNNALAKNDRLANLEKQYNEGLIKLKIYEERRESISKEYERTEISNEVARLTAVIAVRKNAGEDISELQKSLFDAEDNLRKFDLEEHKKAEEKKTEKTKKELEERRKIFGYTIDLLKESIDSVLDDGVAKVALNSLADLYKSIRDITDNENLSQSEKFAEYAAATIAATQTIVNSAFDAGAQKRKEALDAEIARLEALKAKELDNKNLTEQQKADIEEKFRQREAAAKRKAYEDDKRAKIAQAEINGALAITNILATRPKFDLGIGDAIMIAAALATTAIQVGKIKAAQVPQFRDGEVDIKGPGTSTSDSILARISAGESVINAASTAKYKDILKAINEDNLSFEDLILSMIPKVDTDLMSNTYVSKDGSLIDYEKIATVIADKIPEPTYISMNMDENGINKFFVKKNTITQIKNKRLKL